jgi:hypothetical protein
MERTDRERERMDGFRRPMFKAIRNGSTKSCRKNSMGKRQRVNGNHALKTQRRKLGSISRVKRKER